jgi:hypothetical protein
MEPASYEANSAGIGGSSGSATFLNADDSWRSFILRGVGVGLFNLK